MATELTTALLGHLKFGFSITIISWIVGMVGNSLIKSRPFYAKLSSLNLIKSKTLNQWFGVGVFKWIVANTFFKYLNQKIKLTRVGVPELKELRKEMTFAEVSHLIGFGFAGAFAAAKAAQGDYLFGLAIMVPNTLLNLHPGAAPARRQAANRQADRKVQLVS